MPVEIIREMLTFSVNLFVFQGRPIIFIAWLVHSALAVVWLFCIIMVGDYPVFQKDETVVDDFFGSKVGAFFRCRQT